MTGSGACGLEADAAGRGAGVDLGAVGGACVDCGGADTCCNGVATMGGGFGVEGLGVMGAGGLAGVCIGWWTGGLYGAVYAGEAVRCGVPYIKCCLSGGSWPILCPECWSLIISNCTSNASGSLIIFTTPTLLCVGPLAAFTWAFSSSVMSFCFLVVVGFAFVQYLSK
jgi:hypothetical protein